MKVLNRCTAKIGEEITIGPSYDGGNLSTGAKLKVIGFDTTQEDVSFDFSLDGIEYHEGEPVLVTRYLTEVNPIWPEETLDRKTVVRTKEKVS